MGILYVPQPRGLYRRRLLCALAEYHQFDRDMGVPKEERRIKAILHYII